jgi:nucleoid-associated protein YgaU
VFAKIFILVAAAVLLWSAVAKSSTAHGHKVTYRVRPYDTLWTIASKHYGGDLSGVVWQIQHANHLGSTTISPGEMLVLP